MSPPASSGAAAAAVVDVNKVFVGGIGQDADESDVRELFSSLGAVGDVALLPDRETGRHRGFAFVTFAGEGAARAAEDACAKRYHSIKGKVVEESWELIIPLRKILSCTVVVTVLLNPNGLLFTYLHR